MCVCRVCVRGALGGGGGGGVSRFSGCVSVVVRHTNIGVEEEVVVVVFR